MVRKRKSERKRETEISLRDSHETRRKKLGEVEFQQVGFRESKFHRREKSPGNSEKTTIPSRFLPRNDDEKSEPSNDVENRG